MEEENKRNYKNNLYDDEEIVDPSQKEDDEASSTVVYSITSFGADYTVDGIVKRLKDKDIIFPHFQREYVWNWGQASKFIESLLLGLPVPGIFLSKDEDNRLLVVDGRQRLTTLENFYNRIFNGKEFKLKGVKQEFEGLSYKTLNDVDKRRLNDSIIHATIIKQEDPEDNQSSIYLIFERLNTLGTSLSSQEIRSCVYHGEFCDLLGELNNNADWRRIYGPVVSKRLRDQEMILRFFSLYYNLSSYKRPMKEFLGNFMGKNRHLKKYSKEELKNIFEKTVAFAAKHSGPEGFRPERALNVSVTDAILIATAHRLQSGEINRPESYKEAHRNILGKKDFLEKCQVGTTSVENVNDRINIAKEAFNSVT